VGGRHFPTGARGGEALEKESRYKESREEETSGKKRGKTLVATCKKSSLRRKRLRLEKRSGSRRLTRPVSAHESRAIVQRGGGLEKEGVGNKNTNLGSHKITGRGETEKKNLGKRKLSKSSGSFQHQRFEYQKNWSRQISRELEKEETIGAH